MFGRPDNTYSEMTKNSTLQWLNELLEGEDVVNRHGAKLTLEYLAMLDRKIQELEDKNALKDEFLKKLKEKNKEQ